MSDAVIEIDRLSVVRGGRTIVSVERLAVGRGEVLAVLGPNGAGKSTLLKCCTGAVRPSSGTVHVLGLPVHRLRGPALTRLRRRVACLAQLLPLGGEMPLTLREVVAIGRTGRAGLLRPLARTDWRLIDEWIERLGLGGHARQSYGVLSGGEQRKALLAMAMVQQPEILLLDEPAANLDAYWREQIVTTLEDLHREGNLTIVLVCHDLETLPAGTRRVVILREGQIAACGGPEDVITHERIQDLYGPGLTVLQCEGRYLLAPHSRGGPR
jgi:ABC-type cobalamin/Fe3+-siderophores transport system ATPase subunit